MGLSRVPSGPLIPELFLCFGRCFLGRTRWFWGPLGWPLLRAWESPPVSDKGYSFQGQVLSPSLLNMLAALGFRPSSASLWDLCLPGIQCLACGGPLGLSPPPIPATRWRQPVSQAWLGRLLIGT
uniref:Uncharacterized protein n=1 Tax=Molossus molossus TaxID=27622 RepID=A0A7J8CYQ2_MOLMO|nr:hypothetical protein HJG59_009419 [Molossus molossus]